jgi:tRNA threonylcarbamoyladenosine biosynthesis protein TsaB
LKILAFDCAGARCTAALRVGGETIAARAVCSERGHAQLLMPMLDDLLKGAGLGYRDIDRFAVTTGPGSFTGIRVALAAAHGLAIGTGKPVIGATVFEAMAEQAVEQGCAAARLLVAVESRRAECFVQLFEIGTRPTVGQDGSSSTGGRPRASKLGEPAMLAPAHIADWVGGEPVALVGDAADRLAPFLVNAAYDPGSPASVDPAILARLGEERQPGPPLLPFYCREADAVPNRRPVPA